MPIQATNTNQPNGELEDVQVSLLSQLAKLFTDKKLADGIVIYIPDTGKAKFSGSHEITTGKQIGKMSKATFVIGELGSTFAGVDTGWQQSQGEHKGLNVFVKMSAVCAPPNRAGKTIDEALNRKSELKAVAA